MEGFSERLYKLMRNAALTEKNMASLLGVSEQKIENLLTGYIEADIDTISRIAQIFNVAHSYAAAISDVKMCKEPDKVKEVFIIQKFSDPTGMITRKDIKDTLYMNKEDMHGKEYFALIAPDDSMVKSRIYKDDILIVRRQSFADNGDVVVVIDEESTLVRRYSRVGNVVTLTAEGDRIKYNNIKIDTTEQKLVIAGKVCEIRVRKI